MRPAKYSVKVRMDVTYELGLEVMANSPEEAQAKADQIAQNCGDIGEMLDSSPRRFSVKEI